MMCNRVWHVSVCLFVCLFRELNVDAKPEQMRDYQLVLRIIPKYLTCQRFFIPTFRHSVSSSQPNEQFSSKRTASI